jgi:ribosomal protein S18 acetylase RimI-like enzyme
MGFFLEILEKMKEQNQITVREANLVDLEAIVEVARDAFESEYEKYDSSLIKSFFAENINSEFNGVYVVQSGDQVDGYVLYVPIVLVGTCEAVQGGIRKEVQDSGLGSALLSQSRDLYIEKLKNKGIDVYAMYLTTSSDNPVGQKLYRKHGFVETGEIRDTFIGKGNVEVVMSYIVDESKVYEPGTLWNKLNTEK